MDLTHLILYVAVIVTAGIFTPLAAGMRKKYRQPFLNSLFYLVLFFNLASFFSIVWNNVLIDVLKLTESDTRSVIYFLLQNLFLLIPIYLFLIFFLIKTILEMGGRVFSRRSRTVFFTLCGLFMILKLYFLAGYLGTGMMTPFQTYSHWIFWILAKVILLVIPLAIFLWKSRLPGDRVRRGVSGFGVLYLAGMGLVRVLDILNTGNFYVNFVTIVLIIPPLLYLNRQLKFDLIENAGILQPEGGIRDFFEKFNITGREGEIIEYVANGKSNAEIADILFLSEQTIKQHIHSIYKKLDVKNRVQLSNLVRNSLKS